MSQVIYQSVRFQTDLASIKLIQASAVLFFFSSRSRHTRCSRDWSSDVCSSDLPQGVSRSGAGRSGPRQGDAAGVCVCARSGADVGFAVARPGGFGKLAKDDPEPPPIDRKSTRLNSSHGYISYAVFCLKKKKITS